MNQYIPTELKDLTESKQRVMRNVVKEIENNFKRPKPKWHYVVITAVLTVSAMLFVLNETIIENEPSATEQYPDLTKPPFSDEQGTLYLHGITLGDSQVKLIERLGENYTIEQEDGSGADFVMAYGGAARFYFYEDQLISILLMTVDKNYFDQLFNDYGGSKFISQSHEADNDRFIYSKETGQVLKATTHVPDEALYIYLTYATPEFWERPEVTDVSSAENDVIKGDTVEVLENSYMAEDIQDDLNGDGVEDSIRMYISPPPIFDDQGDAAWDDTHVWQLIAEVDGKEYELYHDDVRGVMEFWTVGGANAKDLILFYKGQGLLLYKFKWEAEQFSKEEILYEESVSNRSMSNW